MTHRITIFLRNLTGLKSKGLILKGIILIKLKKSHAKSLREDEAEETQ